MLSVAKELLVLQWCLFSYFFFSVYKISPRKKIRFLQSYRVSDSKFHLVGTLKRSFFDFLNSFLMRKEKLPRIDEKTANIRFRQIESFNFFVISKLMTWKSWNFYPIFNLVIYLCGLSFFKFFCNFGLFIEILDFGVSKFLKWVILGFRAWKFYTALNIRYSN